MGLNITTGAPPPPQLSTGQCLNSLQYCVSSWYHKHINKYSLTWAYIWRLSLNYESFIWSSLQLFSSISFHFFSLGIVIDFTDALCSGVELKIAFSVLFVCLVCTVWSAYQSTGDIMLQCLNYCHIHPPLHLVHLFPHH